MTAAARKPARVGSATTRTLERGLRVLEVVAARPNATLGDIAQACALSPSTTLRILDTLRSRDFVIRADETRTYSIGFAAFEVGMQFRSDTRLRETCALILRRIVEETGQTALLAVLEGRSAVVIDLHEGTGVLRSTARVGARYPAHATAPGKALLAWQWDARLRDLLGEEPYEAYTPRTITTREGLLSACAEIRATGVALDREEHSLDVFGLACPVRDFGSDVIAALAIQGPAGGLAGREEAWGAILRAASLEASHRLGWRDGAPGGAPLLPD